MRPLACLVAFAAALSVAGAAHAKPDPRAPLPGWWRYDTSMFSSDSSERCLDAEQIDKALHNPSNRHYECEYPVRDVANGKARFEGVCTNRKHGQTAKVSLTGTYGPERFDLKGVVGVSLGPLSLPVSATISARRLSAQCPATPPAPG